MRLLSNTSRKLKGIEMDTLMEIKKLIYCIMQI